MLKFKDYFVNPTQIKYLSKIQTYERTVKETCYYYLLVLGDQENLYSPDFDTREEAELDRTRTSERIFRMIKSLLLK